MFISKVITLLAAIAPLDVIGVLGAKRPKQGVFLLSNQPENEVGVYESLDDGALSWVGAYKTGGIGYPEADDADNFDSLGSSNAVSYFVWNDKQFIVAANAGGPTVSMYQNGVLTQTNTWSAGVWNREPGFDRELGVSTTYAYKGDAPNQNIKLFQIIDGLLDATEVAALYDNREAQASSIGGVRTFELSHTKNYEANTFQSSYLDGFLDISGGELRTRNADDHLLIGGDASM